MKRGKIHDFYKSGKKNQRKKHHSLYAGRKGTYKAGTCPSYGIKFSDRRENCRRICRAGDVHPAGYEYGESGRTESGDLSVEPGFCAYPAFVPSLYIRSVYVTIFPFSILNGSIFIPLLIKALEFSTISLI